MKNKKTIVAIISVIALVLVIIGVTYAYWLVTKTQTNKNTITTGCLDISITGEANDITLTNQFPLSDEDGMALTPYEFTITNNCTTSVDYQVALESMGTESTAIKSSAIKVALDEEVALLSNKAEVETTVSGAYAANRLVYGTLAAKSDTSTEDEGTYKLRIWIDADAPISEQNKEFTSKISVTVGQGIVNPIKEGTLAYDILSNYGGTSAITTLSAKWVDGTYGEVQSKLTLAYVSYYWGSALSLNTTTGKYTLVGNIVQATVEECRNGQKSDGTIITCGEYTLMNRTSATDGAYTAYRVLSLISEEITDTTSYKYITVQKKTPKNNFSEATIASEAGLYKATDDLGDSYYFRGNVSNNYVKFGTYAAGSTVNGVTYEEETPLYWRIVRINGDSSIRLIYDGTEKVANGVTHTATIGVSAYNENNANAKYFGYTYEETNDEGETIQVDSTIKGVIDTWYDKHLETSYGKYIEDSIFCNDRSVASIDVSYTTYAAHDRLGNNKAPILKCTNKEDRYTTNDITNGNGYLSNPVGLLTADEASMAGAVYSSGNDTYYLYNSREFFYTMSPGISDGNTYMFFNQEDGSLQHYDYTLSSIMGVRPVINLKADVTFTGDGSYDTPYEIVIE